MKTDYSSTNYGGMSARSRGGLPNRIRSFGATMAVMGGSFIVYYLGLFGGASGPLQPDRIGDRLAAVGFSGHHLLFLLLALTLVSLSWNWFVNAFRRCLGLQMRCAVPTDASGAPCGRPVQKLRQTDGSFSFSCPEGHNCSKARPVVVKKGTLGHFLWMMWLAFSIIVYYYIR